MAIAEFCEGVLLDAGFDTYSRDEWPGGMNLCLGQTTGAKKELHCHIDS
jgi:hypothetical protein